MTNGHRTADGDHLSNGAPLSLQALDFQVQTAFEQDDRHSKPCDNAKGGTQGFGTNNIADIRPQKNAEDEQKNNSGYAQMIGR
jgi:hypothetical protein